MTTKHAPRALEAAATREGRWWVVRVPELGAVGQARTVREIRAVAVEVAALHLNIPEGEVTVHLTVHVSTEAEQLWERARQLEEEARAVQQHAAELRRAAVRQVREDGYKLDAAAAAFGVTTSRIQQLAVDSGVS